MTVRAVLFDWDGTLFDMFDFLVETYTEVFTELGIEPWSVDKYRKSFRCDWRSMLSEMGLSDHTEKLIDYWNHKKQKSQDELYLHPGAKQLVEALQNEYVLGIVSSAPRQALTSELSRLRMDSYFSVVLSLDDTRECKPHPGPLLEAAQKLGVDPRECVYIGDMVEDIQSAKAAKMHSIAVSWGIHEEKILSDQKPDALASSFPEVADYINELKQNI